MKKLISKISRIVVLCLSLSILSTLVLAQSSVFPSTNEDNMSNGWAHVEQVSVGIGTTDLMFVSTRAFASCFEYRTDGDTSQVIGTNYNPAC